MNSIAFLLNMSISGIKNLEEEVRIDFSGKNISQKFNPDKYRIKGIYGENGSGKTAIITAVDIVKSFMLNPNYLREKQNQDLLKELINKNKREFYFRCEFITNIEKIYIYEYILLLSFDEEENVYVSYESLKYKKNNSANTQSTVFICKDGELDVLNLGDDISSMLRDRTKNLLDKQSALFSCFYVFGDSDSIKNMPGELLYSTIFFLLLHVHYDRSDKHIDYYNRIRFDKLKQEFPSEKLVEELQSIIPTTESRVPVAEIENYEKRIRQLERLVRLFKPELRSIEIEKRQEKEYYHCELVMDYGSYKVNREFESTGIKKIIDLYDAFTAVSTGLIVFIDEMDSNINEVYLCKLLEYFKYYGNGQLCFTSHNTDPMYVLRENSKSIDFITRDQRIVPWIKNGHYTPENSYRNGMIEGLPFNIDPSDFISIFERED